MRVDQYQGADASGLEDKIKQHVENDPGSNEDSDIPKGYVSAVETIMKITIKLVVCTVLINKPRTGAASEWSTCISYDWLLIVLEKYPSTFIATRLTADMIQGLIIYVCMCV